MYKNEITDIDNSSLDRLCTDSVELVKYVRNTVANQVNIFQTMTYYCI